MPPEPQDSDNWEPAVGREDEGPATPTVNKFGIQFISAVGWTAFYGRVP